MSTEVIVIHVGQAGTQIGNSFWNLLCGNHGVSPDGDCISDTKDKSLNSFFKDLSNGKYVPRVIFFDSDPTVIDEIRTGVFKQLYHPSQLISLKEDASNNFARGTFRIVRNCLSNFSTVLNKMMEEVENAVSILFFSSIGGGSGSGTGAAFLQEIKTVFPKAFLFQICIEPSAVLCNAVVEPYNAILHTNCSLDNDGMSMLFDNESFYEICTKLMLNESPTYTNINNLMSTIVNSIVCLNEHDSSIYNSLCEINTNLVPFPRLHYPMASYAPIHISSDNTDKSVTLEQMTKDVFSRSYQTIKCELNEGRYLSIMLSYRGLISTNDVAKIMVKYKKSTMNFVEWCPSGIKMSVNQESPIRIPSSEMAYSDKTVTMMCNSTAVKLVWDKLMRKFELLYDKMSFVHWYLNEGMEKMEFDESLMNIKMLNDDYEEVSLSEAEILDILERFPERKSRSLSLRTT